MPEMKQPKGDEWWEGYMKACMSYFGNLQFKEGIGCFREAIAEAQRREREEIRGCVESAFRGIRYDRRGVCKLCGLEEEAGCLCMNWNEALGSVLRLIDERGKGICS